MNADELESRFSFIQNGHVTAMIVAEATFYFTDLEKTKNNLIDAYKRILDELRPHMTMYATENMDQAKKINTSVDSLFTKWFGGKKVTEGLYALSIQSGDNLESVGPWGFEFEVDADALNPLPNPLDPEPVPDTTGVFYFTMPVHTLFDKHSSFRHLVTDVARILPFHSGHAGFGIQYANGYQLPERDQQIFTWACQFIGLDCPDSTTDSMSLHDHVKGAQWLTLLDNDFISRLGGETVITKMLGSEFIIERFNDRLMIQAGSQPILGDTSQNEDMSPYVKVNELILPVRVPDLFPLPGFEHDTAAKWLRRFDRQS